MKLEDQVVSLELAQKLKELGVKQESLFYWHPRLDGANRPYIVPSSHRNGTSPNKDFIAAFTAAELGEMLPKVIPTTSSRTNAGWIDFQKHDASWSVTYIAEWTVNAPTEADARAKMLIYLIENKLVGV